MKKLSNAQVGQKEMMRDSLEEANAAINKQVAEVNAAIVAANAKIEDLNRLIGIYNEVVGDAEEWRDEIANEIEAYMDERSEKWQESDKADYYRSWKEEFDNLEVSVYDEVPEFEEIDWTDDDLSDQLTNINDALPE